MTLSKPRVIVDMLYDVMQHIHYRSREEEQDDDWLVDAIQNAEDMSAELASPEKGVPHLFFYDLTYYAIT